MASENREFALIDWIRRRAAAHPRLVLGIGDDAAVLSFPNSAGCLVTVDMLMEGVHFTLADATPYQVGRKALAVNLSDVAAMAGRPLAAFAAVALPRSAGMEFARELHAGIQELADQFGVALAGGDTNIWDGPLVVSITLLGEATERGPVGRKGARAGDWLLVTGVLGGSLAGKHLSFEPRVNEALALHRAAPIHAMIDLSDGLVADMYHILGESGVTAELYEPAIPISEDANSMTGEKTPLERALGDGEDFELLFTVAPDDGRKLLAQPPVELPLSHIGVITAMGDAPCCELVDETGQRRLLPPIGWEHRFDS